MADQRIEHVIKDESGGQASRADKDTRKQVKKQTEYAKEAEKVRKTSLLKTAGINLSLAGVLKQSQVFTSTLGTVFQLLGALVDVILAPFLQVVVPAIKSIAKLIPVISQWSRKLAEEAIPKIQAYMAPLYEGIQKVATLSEGGFAQIGEWFIQLGKDFITKWLPASYEWQVKAAKWLWDRIKEIYAFLKTEFKGIQTFEDFVKDLWQSIKTVLVGEGKNITDFFDLWKAGETPVQKKFTEFWKKATNIWDNAKLTGENLYASIVRYIDTFKIYFGWLSDSLPQIWENLGTAIEDLSEYLGGVFEYHVVPHLKAIEYNSKLAYGFISAYFPKIYEGLKEYLGGLNEYLKRLIDAFTTDFKDVLNNIPHNIEEALKAGISMGLLGGNYKNASFNSLAAMQDMGIYNQLTGAGSAKMAEGIAGLEAGFSYRKGADFFRDPNVKEPIKLEIDLTSGIESIGRAVIKAQNKVLQEKQVEYNEEVQAGGGPNFGAFDVYGEESAFGWR